MRPIQVLVVEDDNLANTSACSILKDLNCEVTSVSRGMDALNFLKKIPYNLVLLDIGLPDINGLLLAQYVRSQAGENKKTPLIGITAHVIGADEKACFDVGMNGYMRKPVVKKDLEHLLAEYCAG